MARKMGILGEKIGMTQVYRPDGKRVPVTVLRAGPCVVTALRKADRDGYTAVQLGFDERPQRVTSRPEAGIFAAAKTTPKRFVREVRLDVAPTYELGQTITLAEVFKAGDIVDVRGTSKGQGFQGVLKRHNMKGSKQATHGTHEYRRHPGSIGCRLTPGRVHKGKRMPGHMGDERVTVQRLEIIKVIPEENLLAVCGAVPGPNGGYVVVCGTARKIRIPGPAVAPTTKEARPGSKAAKAAAASK